MDFQRTEEQELLLESLRELMKNFPDNYWRESDEQGKVPMEWHHAMVESDFAFLGVPKEYGGTPIDAVTHMMVIEEVGRLGGPINLMGSFMRIRDMIHFGSAEQMKFTMEAIRRAPLAFCIGASEPQAGSDSKAINTRFVRRNGKVYISGQKTFISNAMIVEKMLTMALGDDDKMSMWMVPLNAPGVKKELIHKIGFRNSSTCDVYLDNVELEESDLVGKEGGGFIQLMENYAFERIVIAAQAVGTARAAYEDAMRYANQRVQFGKKIGEFQLIQQKALEMYVKVKNMQNMLYEAAWKIDQGIDDRVLPNAAKYYCTRACCEVVDDALQVMGGIGYSDDCRVSRLWRDARALRLTGGTDEIMIHAAGRAALKLFAK